jgi:hypothetical protein
LNNKFDKNIHFFIHVEIFKKDFLERFCFVKKNEMSFGIFENILLFEIKISKLNHYSTKN